MTTASAAQLRRLPLADIHESKLNPRTRFDPAEVLEIARSLGASGQLAPCIVRPRKGGGFELAAGACRRRAAAMPEAGPLKELECVVREMSDVVFVETLNVENLQRHGLHPMEECAGFMTLIRIAGYSIADCAQRVGMDKDYVYDRLNLAKLTPALQNDFLKGRFQLGHAIALSRLAPADQTRVAHREDGGLYEREAFPLFEQDGQESDRDPMKTRSVRELQAYIDLHVRFRPEKVDLPALFPKTAEAIAYAAEQELKVVKITYEHYIQPETRDEKERVYGPRSWERADGQAKSKTCDFSVMGMVTVGQDRGASFRVCIDKKKCRTHWKAPAKPGATEQQRSAQAKREETAEAKRRQREAAEHRERQRWAQAAPAILQAFAAKIKKAPAGAGSLVAEAVLERIGRRVEKRSGLKPFGKSAEDVLRYSLMLILAEHADNTYWAPRELPKFAKRLGLKLGPLLTAAEKALVAAEAKDAKAAPA